MAVQILVPLSLFLFLFGIVYLFFSTRNKERMALIEKGADASIFVQKRTNGASHFWKIFILNLALLLMGVGLAIFLGLFLTNVFQVRPNVAFPGCIFFMAGAALMIGFFLTKKMDKED